VPFPGSASGSATTASSTGRSPRSSCRRWSYGGGPAFGRPETARLLFSTRERTALARTYFNRHVWKPALAVAGVPATRDNGMHAARHYYASALLEDGVSIRAVAEYLGHNDPGFTLRVYAHLMPSSEGRARAAIDRALGGSPVVAQAVAQDA
jgi:integrase